MREPRRFRRPSRRRPRPQGRRDQVAPGEAAQRFHDSLTAPSKQLVWFENSAHTPHLEEPGKFRDLLMNVRARWLASTRG